MIADLADLSESQRAQLASLRGLVSEAVGLRLAALAAAVTPPHVIVEIGSFRGKSTCYLAAGARAGARARVYAVDPWDLPGNVTGKHGYAEPATRAVFEAQVAAAKLTRRITPIQAFSTDVAAGWGTVRRPIGLLFLDGSHLEVDVRQDLIAWRPHLVDPGGWIVFDDYRTRKNPGVTAVVDALQQEPGWVWDVDTPPLAIGRRV